VELIYLASQGVYFFRTFYQVKVTHDAQQSITPLPYWVMSLFGELLVLIYGLLIGSWAMPATALRGFPFTLYNRHIELKRGKK